MSNPEEIVLTGTTQLWEECPKCGQEPIYLETGHCKNCVPWRRQTAEEKIATSRSAVRAEKSRADRQAETKATKQNARIETLRSRAGLINLGYMSGIRTSELAPDVPIVFAEAGYDHTGWVEPGHVPTLARAYFESQRGACTAFALRHRMLYVIGTGEHVGCSGHGLLYWFMRLFEAEAYEFLSAGDLFDISTVTRSNADGANHVWIPRESHLPSLSSMLELTCAVQIGGVPADAPGYESLTQSERNFGAKTTTGPTWCKSLVCADGRRFLADYGANTYPDNLEPLPPIDPWEPRHLEIGKPGRGIACALVSRVPA